MRKAKIVLVSGVLALTLAGCSAAAMSGSEMQSNTPEPATIAVAKTETAIPTAEPSETATAILAPVEEAVLGARERVLEGLNTKQIERLIETIKAANLCLEQEYMFNNLFGKLEDPESLYWNYFHQIGEIQIGWVVEGSVDMVTVCAEEDLTEDEFYAKYGAPVVATNHYDADKFISLLEELNADVRSEDLKAELQYIIDETALARDTHVMEHVNNIYKKLHDMDYFLLRYGPTDVGPYVKDDSTITKYYGTLSIYD